MNFQHEKTDKIIKNHDFNVNNHDFERIFFGEAHFFVINSQSDVKGGGIWWNQVNFFYKHRFLDFDPDTLE